MDIRINTRLPGLILLGGIRSVSKTEISGWTHLPGRDNYLLLEALAQLGAMHTRFLCEFNRHAFLLKITRFAWKAPEPEPEETDRRCELSGRLTVQTGSAAAYTVKAWTGPGILGEGELSFAVTDYGRTFEMDRLKRHYQGMFACLTGLKSG